MEENISLKNDFDSLTELSFQSGISSKEIFEKIGQLDKKYLNNEIYQISINGLICNIGSDLSSIPLLNYALKRIQSKKDLIDPNKYNYDFGNILFSKASIEVSNDDYFLKLLENKTYREAQKYFLKVKYDKYGHYERARTNLAIIFERYGRNYEAINSFDQVIKNNPKFGMAYGGKALSLEYYTRLAPQQSLLLLDISLKLLNEAFKDNNLLEVGGVSSFNYYKSYKEKIEYYFNQINYIPSENSLPKSLSKYQKFIISNNLFLNFDFGYYYDKDSLIDNFFLKMVESVNDQKYVKSHIMSKKTYFCFQVFNQIVEDFTTSRYNYFHASLVKYKKIDSRIKFVYTFDYTKHSLKYGLLKSVFTGLYNCLDKIAHILKYYYLDQNEFERVDTYFDWLSTNEYKNIVKSNGHFQLLALHSLSLDMKSGGCYQHLAKIRNRITHSFLNVNVDIGFDERYEEFEITEDQLEQYINELFIIVKSALMYVIIAFQHLNEIDDSFPMFATLQNDIYK